MSVTDDVVVLDNAVNALLFPAALILTTAVLSCLPGAPSAPGCLAASGRQALLRPRPAAGAPPVSAEPAGAVSGCRWSDA
ncbi:hypothetical protein K8Q81_23815 [Escherichia coli]